MRRGIMFFDVDEQNWKIWIGQQEYETFTGMNFEIRIQHRYFEACFEEDYQDCIVTLEDDVTFTLRLVEVYKVRILAEELMPALDLPF
ncbi:hypothetical protein MUB24_20170 [Lederbergia sp. NSJ-179]|uniref:hypothetical protein n=1 Tax=Lederbergia sp. NSJ-179 TaxID=2931402 RepID=UPI001FD2829A|nr:hypothetical protein [Lederbergia sp. NSJ-179]MCJ7843150.1 hypothetical protein [Lederbergia sp. NSJ-179]